MTDELVAFDIDTMSFRETSANGGAPTPRYKHAGCLVPERRGKASVFYFGGCDEEGVALNDEYLLDLSDRSHFLV